MICYQVTLTVREVNLGLYSRRAVLGTGMC